MKVEASVSFLALALARETFQGGFNGHTVAKEIWRNEIKNDLATYPLLFGG